MKAIFLSAVSCFAGQDVLRLARESLAAGDYLGAWQRIESGADEIDRRRVQAEILYRAGDPAGALKAARAGLGIAPGQLDLLYHAAGASIWLEDGQGGMAFSSRLLQAAEAVQGTEGRAWLTTARDLSSRGETLVRREGALKGALTRLRSISVGGLALWMVALWIVLRLQGKSSKPVS